MCGRFTLRTNREELAEHFGIPVAELPPRYNIAPTQEVLAVRAAVGGREAVNLRWGLIPSWAKDKNIGAKLINARADTVADKGGFALAQPYSLVRQACGKH